MNTNQKVTVNQIVFRNLYFRYRDFVTPVSVLLVCLLLFWFIVIPQIQSFWQQRDTLAVDTQNLAVMHKNLSLITSLDDAKLNQLLSTATSALPPDKDFTGIISSIQQAAAISGANLGDYSFGLGNLSGVDQNGKATQLPLQLNVQLKGSVLDAQRFAVQLSKQLPLANAVAISVGSNQSITVTAIFYYAQIQKITFQDSRPLPIITNSDIQLLDNLANQTALQPVSIGTPSASITPTPSVSPALPATSSAATSSAL